MRTNRYFSNKQFTRNPYTSDCEQPLSPSLRIPKGPGRLHHARMLFRSSLEVPQHAVGGNASLHSSDRLDSASLLAAVFVRRTIHAPSKFEVFLQRTRFLPTRSALSPRVTAGHLPTLRRHRTVGDSQERSGRDLSN